MGSSLTPGLTQSLTFVPFLPLAPCLLSASAPRHLAACLGSLVTSVVAHDSESQDCLLQLAASLEGISRALAQPLEGSQLGMSLGAVDLGQEPSSSLVLRLQQAVREVDMGAAAALARLSELKDQVGLLQHRLDASQQQIAALQVTAEAEWSGLHAQASRSVQVRSYVGNYSDKILLYICATATPYPPLLDMHCRLLSLQGRRLKRYPPASRPPYYRRKRGRCSWKSISIS